jgi:hypothetical protein
LTSARAVANRLGSPVSARIAAAPTGDSPVMEVTSSVRRSSSSTAVIRCSLSPGLCWLWAQSSSSSWTHRQGTEARQAFPALLAELGHPMVTNDFPYDDLPWRGYWDQIWWAVDQMDRTHTPYASAQRVLEVLDDVPDLWGPGRGRELTALLQEWDEHPDQRNELGGRIRAHLRSLREDDVPPLQ